MSTAPLERRSASRTPLAMPVLCSWQGKERHTGEAVNVSAGGMLLQLHPTPEPGTRLLLAFGLMSLGTEFVVSGEVTRLDGGGRVGVRYLWNSAKRRALLAASLAVA